MQESGFPNFHPGFLVLIVTEIISPDLKIIRIFMVHLSFSFIFFLFDLKLLHVNLKFNYNLFQLFSIIS